MRLPGAATVLLGTAIVGAAGTVLAADKLDIGKREYEANCAACHGQNGKGDGRLLDFLKYRPADLTVLSKNNKGVFPFVRAYEAIDGRLDVRGHGDRDMPVWGNDYLAQVAPDYEEYPYNAEIFVRSRILALIEYLYRLQTK